VRALPLLLTIVLASCVAATPEEMDAARRGRDDARADLARGRPRQAVIGFLRDDESLLEPTGRVRFSVGCCKSHERIAYCDAYESVMDAARADGRLAGLTLEKKATTRDAVAARFASAPGVEVKMGGPGAPSPDGRFRVEASPASGVYGVALWEIDATTGEKEELRRLGADRASVLFDATNGTLLVHDARVGAFATFDLATALPLQVFSER